MRCDMRKILSVAIGIVLFSLPAYAMTEAELAKALANPVANLISVPISVNYDQNIGPDEDGSVLRYSIQPVIPFTLNEDWNMISRTILTMIKQDNIPVEGEGESGMGDIVQSFFFSPKESTSGGVVWGVGPVFLLPTASEEVLGSEKWGIGPTAVVLKQGDPVTFGFLTNHIESVAGSDDRADVSSTLIQPFFVYITKTKTSISLNTESTYDWENEQWSILVNLMVNQMVKVGKLPFQVGAGVSYWAESPEYGPKDWGGKLQVTFIFPKF